MPGGTLQTLKAYCSVWIVPTDLEKGLTKIMNSYPIFYVVNGCAMEFPF